MITKFFIIDCNGFSSTKSPMQWQFASPRSCAKIRNMVNPKREICISHQASLYHHFNARHKPTHISNAMRQRANRVQSVYENNP